MNDHPVIDIEGPDGPIWITSSWRHKEQCKLVPGAKWDDTVKKWRVPLSWAACKQLRAVFGEELLVGENLREWAGYELQSRVAPAAALRNATGLADGFSYDDRLYQFQQAGVAFLIAAGSAILADEMGTGKTVQMCVTLRELDKQGEDPFPCLIVAPNSVKSVWRKHVEEWIPGATVAVADKGAANRRKAILSGADVVIINYESTWRNSRLAPYGNTRLSDSDKEPKELNEVGWRTVVLDEAHRTKAPKAKQTRACWAIAHGKTVTRRYALTGTPMANAPDDYWSILHLVAPDEWPSRTRYVDRYCLMSWNPFGGMNVVGLRPDTKDEFFEITDARMRRMPKDLVLPFLPPKVRSRRDAEMTPKQEKAYKQMEATQTAELEEAIASSANKAWTAATLPIVQRLRLMQFSSAHAYVDSDNKVHLDYPSNKVEELLAFVDELPSDEPIVVFAESRQLIELAGRKLEEMHKEGKYGSVTYIVGGMTADEREQATTDFQEGRAQAILCTIKAGGEGITLTRARQCVFMQRSDSMIGNKQAEDRIHRIGSEVHTSVNIVDLVAPGTVEEEQISNLVLKLQRLEEIVRDKATLRAAADSGNQDAVAKLAQLELEENGIMAEDSVIRSALESVED